MQVGLLYSDAGQFAKAGPYFSQALSMLEGELGPSHLHLANVCNGEPSSLQPYVTLLFQAPKEQHEQSHAALLPSCCHAWSAALCCCLRLAAVCTGQI